MECLIERIRQQYSKIFITSKIRDNLLFPKEIETGFIEYKQTLVHCNAEKIEQYASQMKWRISENIKKRNAIYYIGLEDCGTIKGLNDEDIIYSVQNFIKICNIINASIKYIEITTINDKNILKICVKLKKKLEICDFDF